MAADNATLFLILRIAAGLLALACFVLVSLRLYSLLVLDIEFETGERFVNVLRIVFPLSLGLIAAYVAVKGVMPAGRSRDGGKG